jgi:hypothetical protein
MRIVSESVRLSRPRGHANFGPDEGHLESDPVPHPWGPWWESLPSVESLRFRPFEKGETGVGAEDNEGTRGPNRTGNWRWMVGGDLNSALKETYLHLSHPSHQKLLYCIGYMAFDKGKAAPKRKAEGKPDGGKRPEKKQRPDSFGSKPRSSVKYSKDKGAGGKRDGKRPEKKGTLNWEGQPPPPHLYLPRLSSFSSPPPFFSL